MCGIVGAVSKRNVASILIGGLKKLEYRGYDSAGIAVIGANNSIELVRTVGKVVNLETALQKHPIKGRVGIGHTRWATHGEPAEYNAHPQISSSLAVVHNGIIENHIELRAFLEEKGYKFTSDTDTEVIAHLIEYYFEQEKDLPKAIRCASNDFEGAYALGIISKEKPDMIYAIKYGSPLVVGVGIEENFIASDSLALSPNVENVIYLMEGDLAVISEDSIKIYDIDNKKVSRTAHEITKQAIDISQKGEFKHYMLKEIFEQPKAIKDTLEGRFSNNKAIIESFGYNMKDIFLKTKNVYILACGTSYHAGLIAKYWIESIVGIPCIVEIASEFRYRDVAINPDTLLITVSQSGETADTIAALKKTKTMPFLSRLSICNVANSTLVRDSDGHILTRAGLEIGVASTKGFITQLTVLLLLSLSLRRSKKDDHLLTGQDWDELIFGIDSILDNINLIQTIAEDFIDKQSTLFLGRGIHYPLALEGALKLKEISYIHAESHAAGELKHGPLALVDKDMPVLFVAPDDHLFKKIKSNISEVHSRGGKLYIFTNSTELQEDKRFCTIPMPTVNKIFTPILYSVPLQLLAYYVAVLKGTDVDQPRNLAKSVTVE